jgi:hypothetical protein
MVNKTVRREIAEPAVVRQSSRRQSDRTFVSQTEISSVKTWAKVSKGGSEKQAS